MGMRTRPTDADHRIAAVTTFDRNVLVVAGAGTGKTALLTARALVYLLGESPLRRPERSAAVLRPTIMVNFHSLASRSRYSIISWIL